MSDSQYERYLERQKIQAQKLKESLEDKNNKTEIRDDETKH